MIFKRRGSGLTEISSNCGILSETVPLPTLGLLIKDLCSLLHPRMTSPRGITLARHALRILLHQGLRCPEVSCLGSFALNTYNTSLCSYFHLALFFLEKSTFCNGASKIIHFKYLTASHCTPQAFFPLRGLGSKRMKSNNATHLHLDCLPPSATIYNVLCTTHE